MTVVDLPSNALTFGALNAILSGPVSRTIMLPELALLLDATALDAAPNDYRAAAIEENVLLKPSRAAREKTYYCLRDRYALDPRVPLFRALRLLIAADPGSAPLIALLLAAARDPLMRLAFTVIESAETGSVITKHDFLDPLHQAYEDRLSANTIKTVAERMGSSWTQSGHLTGRMKRIRTRVEASPASVTMALLLGHACDLAGERLFSTIWMRMLDQSPATAVPLAQLAGRKGWIEFRHAGDVIDITFRGLLGGELSPR